MPKFLFPLLLFSNALDLSIKASTLIQSQPLNLCLLFEFLLVGYLFQSSKHWCQQNYVVLFRQLYIQSLLLSLPATFFQRKSYLKILYICGNLRALKELFISYEFSGLCFAESFCDVAHGKSPRMLSVSYCVKIYCLALDTLR